MKQYNNKYTYPQNHWFTITKRIPQDIKDEIRQFANSNGIREVCKEIITKKTAKEILELCEDSPINWTLAFLATYKSMTNYIAPKRSFLDFRTDENKKSYHRVACALFPYLI